MTTVIHGENVEVDALIERRRALGEDGHDEIWKGVYHEVPHANARHGRLQAELIYELTRRVEWNHYRLTTEFNLGVREDFRVPDLGVHAGDVVELYLPTAVAVVEVLSPGDATHEKFEFYHDRGVQEILVVDPLQHLIECWRRAPAEYDESATFGCARITTDELTTLIRWP